MGLAPPIKSGVVRASMRSEIEPQEEVVIKRDQWYGDRKLITYIKGGPNDWTLEADVLGQLDSRGYIRNDLVFGINCMCLRCTANFWVRPSNKTFYFDPNPTPCPVIGGGIPVVKGHDVGKLTVRERLMCPTCHYTFRITDGVCYGT